ncbi:MAG: replication-relaxation family protein [bacterium]
MGLRITQDDLVLFKYLFEHDFLNRTHIRNYIWQDRHQVSTRRRLAKLTRYGFLKKKLKPNRDRANLTILLPTKKALTALKENEDKFKNLARNNTVFYDKINPDNYKVRDIKVVEEQFTRFLHKEKIINLRLILEDHGAKNWVSKNIIRRKAKLKTIPDGLFSRNGDVFAVELETKKRYDSKYKYKFERYVQEDKVDKIIYIAGYKSIYDNLIEVINPKFFSKFNANTQYQNFYIAKYENMINGELQVINPFKETILEF